MLVIRNRNRKRTSHRGGIFAKLQRDAGSMMVTVLVVMLVLTIGGLALSAIALNTVTSVTDARDRSAAQAEVDGAIATQSVKLMEGRISCDTDPALSPVSNGASPHVINWGISCVESGIVGTATITADATVNGEKAKREVVLSYVVTPPVPGYGSLNFYGNSVVTFTQQVHPGSSENPITLIIPNAGFTCQGEIWGSVVAKGDITINGSGCQVHGDLVSVEGVIKGNQADAKIDGNITTGGTGTNVVYGTVDGNVHTRGPIDFSWSNRTVSGSVISGGNLAIRESRILGTVTIPSSKSVTKSGGSHGALVKLANVPAPELPTLPPWFEFQYDADEWPGFTVRKLEPGLPNTHPNSCGYFNNWPQTGWVEMSSLTGKTVLDGRGCSTLSTNAGTSPNVKLAHDLLILAPKMDTTASKWGAASGLSEKPSVWFVTEDPNPSDAAPSCESGLGDLVLNHVGTGTNIKAMAYTPCTIHVAGASTFNGQLYGKGWNYGGGLTFLPDDISLPGMLEASGGASGGGVPTPGSFVLESSKDLPST